jgi:hypothetical protein
MNRAFTFTVLFACQVFAARTVCSQPDTAVSAAPISLHALKPDGSAPAGDHPTPLATVFLVTNHTAQTVVASLVAVEVKSGSNWITQMRPHGPLQLSTTYPILTPEAVTPWHSESNIRELGPHQTAYSAIGFSTVPTVSGAGKGPVGSGMNYISGQPTGSVWRLTVSVQKKLTGLEGAAADLTHYAEIQSRLAAAGITNAPKNPFSSKYTYFGKPTRVSSEEVTNQ